MWYINRGQITKTLGDKIRQNGQLLFEATRKSCQNFLGQNPTIPRIIALLHAYFPAIRSRVIADTRAPCESASNPNLTDCERWFIKDATSELEKSCLKLPTILHAVVAAGIFLLLTLVSVALFLMHFRWLLILIPIVLAVLLASSFVCLAAYRAKSIASFMADYFDQQYDKLRRAYSTKVEWIVNNTHMTLEQQLVAEISGIGYRLQKKFEDLFNEWESYSKEESESRLAKQLSNMGLEKVNIEMLQDQILDSIGDLLEDAMRDAPPIAGKQKAQEFKQRFTEDIVRQARRKTVDYERVTEQVMNCMSRVDPPVKARLDTAWLQDDKAYKVFLLPKSYPNWEEKLTAQGRQMMLYIRSWRGAINAPIVFTARSHLTLDEMKATLVITEVK